MKHSQKNTLDKALKTHYEAKSLSADQLDTLMTMQATAEENLLTRLLKDFRGYRYAFYATACLLLMTLVVSFSLLNRPPLAERIMHEIAYNHQQEMPIEIASNSLISIGEYLNKLKFPLINSSSLSPQNWQLLGGRYCSINGKLAAQLKVKNLQDNKTYTLYQAAVGSDISKVLTAAKEQAIEGITVSIWQEKGLLLGLAHSN
ncbi:hypothetical protein [Leucothrix arctica]|uniref:DUF3379 domain-containing protein n=1 Tax=Leucothrix arctica TaxID=1481894 RepID=A0A317CG55_9GAMM|nr:hypothetical protein [Leucothrix arctica]PWQ97538.1 hypothetical protein DKT75_06350 [Leucothrix arctica]